MANTPSVMDQYRLAYGATPPQKPESGAGNVFSSGLQGGIGGAGTGAAVSGGNPYVTAGAAIVGTGMGVWQALKNQDATDAAYQNQLAAYNDSLNNQREARGEQQRAQNAADVASGAGFAGSLQDDILSKYRDYYKSIGK